MCRVLTPVKYELKRMKYSPQRRTTTNRILAAVTTCLLAAPAMAERSDAAKAGKRHFIRCAGCHTVTAETRPGFGPHLAGIVGRRVASVEGFEYTPALRAQDFVWTEERLDEWLKNPQAMVHDMCMPFTGLAKPEARAALIAFLKDPGL